MNFSYRWMGALIAVMLIDLVQIELCERQHDCRCEIVTVPVEP